MNPHHQTTLTYPPESTLCANPPASDRANPPGTPPQVYQSPASLPQTGGPSGALTPDA